MPAKKRTTKKTEKAPAKAAAYTISAPNPFYEGRYYDGKVRFIDGKARITDALARTVKIRDGVSHQEYFCEDAEELTRHFMDTVGNDFTEKGEPGPRAFKVTPPLVNLAPVVDDLTPNADRPRRRRGKRIRQEAVMDEAIPSGVPAGADPDQVIGVGRRQRKEAVA